jgi:hypothetical protein
MSASPPIQEHSSSSESESCSTAALGTEAKDARRVRRTASHLSKRRPLLIDLFHPAPKHENPGPPASSNGGQPAATDGGTFVHGAPSERSLYMGSATGTVATSSAATSVGAGHHGYHRPRKGGGPSANVFGDALLDRPSTAVGLPADAARTVRGGRAVGDQEAVLAAEPVGVRGWVACWWVSTHMAQGRCMNATE